MRSLHVCLITAALAACSPPPSETQVEPSAEDVSVTDGFASGLFPTGSQPLHTPYVVGGQIVIRVSPLSGQDLTGWTLSSSDDAVLVVTAPMQPSTAGASTGASQGGDYVTTLSAVGAGSASLVVRDAAGVPVSAEAVSVAAPDQAIVYAPVKLLGGASSSQAEVSQAEVLVTGTSTFLVQYFSGGARLFGAGALTAVATGSIEATTTSPSTSPVDDFLYVTPSTVDPDASISLVVGGAPVGTLAVQAVGSDALAGVAVDQLALGGLGVLYAHATDASGGDIYGATFNWTTTGQDQDGKTNDPAGDPSDIYCYSVPTSTQPGGTLHVTASYGSFASQTTVEGEPFLFTSTAMIPTYDTPSSCSVAGAPGTERRSSGVVGLGLALALVGVGRRRHSRRDNG